MKLRPVIWNDAYSLWLWANDPASRAGSGNRPMIEWVDHLRWLERRVESPVALVLIAESAAGQPVGSIRFETSDHWRSAVLSYVVAPEARGRGFGRALLIEGVAALRRHRPAARVDALVRADNDRSRRLFTNLGWDEETTAEGMIRFVDQSEVTA